MTLRGLELAITGILVGYDDFTLRIKDEITKRDVLIHKGPGLIIFPDFDDMPDLPPRPTEEERLEMNKERERQREERKRQYEERKAQNRERYQNNRNC